MTDESWDRYMEETVLRESVLNWYEFRADACLLEAGYSCGAVTELFCRRVSSVTLVEPEEEKRRKALAVAGKHTNLRVTGDPAQIGDVHFDYIICFDPAGAATVQESEDPAAFVQMLLGLLSPGGILILGADNRFGLKYFCGSGEKYTGVPFMGINGYPREWRLIPEADNRSGPKSHCGSEEKETGGLNGDLREGKPQARPAQRTYSRRQWQEILHRAGAVKSRFYYPVPDNTLPQMIFTDAYQKSAGVVERLNDYDYRDPAMIGIEHRLFRDVIDEGMLPFMANSFLMEVTKDGILSDIEYAVITTDRGPARGMATTVRAGGRVFKRPLWKEGEAWLERLASLTEQLGKKGVRVVPAIRHTDTAGLYLEMPYIDSESLNTVLERAAATDTELFYRIFDQIYEAILLSCTPVEGESRQVFLDLAPCNCFYLQEQPETENRLLFYDQEFVADEGTPGYAMYRTIRYFFASSPKARAVMSADEVYEGYGITGALQEEYEKQEARFISGIRQTDRYKWLLEVSTPDYQAMLERTLRLKTELPAPSEKKPYHVGYVPGVFDLFHKGHLRLIERCKERCDILIVGVLTDELVEFYKGRRPVVSCADRMEVIAGLRAVDRVIPVDFENTDKLKAWEQLHYDCHFSGDDHVNHWNDVWEELKKRGSNMEFFSYTEGISTTAIREKTQRDGPFV